MIYKKWFSLAANQRPQIKAKKKNGFIGSFFLYTFTMLYWLYKENKVLLETGKGIKTLQAIASSNLWYVITICECNT